MSQRLRDKVASLRADADELERTVEKAAQAEKAAATSADEWNPTILAVREQIRVKNIGKEWAWSAKERIVALLDSGSEASKGLTTEQRFARIAAWAASTVRRSLEPGC